MARVDLFGWDRAAEKWVKIECDSSGRIYIDPTLILENPPVEDEAKKAATSEWSYDHWKNASAHHAKYTDANSRAAINNIIASNGKVVSTLYMSYNRIEELAYFKLRISGIDTYSSTIKRFVDNPDIYFLAYPAGGGTASIQLRTWDGSAYKIVATEFVVDTKIEDHRLINNAHHDKYTDNDAQAAVNMVGNLYWSCAGIHFNPRSPDVEGVIRNDNGSIRIYQDTVVMYASVNLPQQAVVTGVIVYGNAAAGDETYILRRIKIEDSTTSEMAAASINSEYTDITNPVIDNATYGYFIYTSTMDTNDEIWGARITYTL